MRFLSLLFVFSQLALLAQCLLNVTVDDTDPQIQYTGDWSRSAETDLNYNSSHALTMNATSQAVFQFTGVAVYFLSPLWPYAVSTALTLDSRPTVTVDLMDYASPATGGGSETVGYSVVWSAENLPNATHTLRISVGRGQQFAIVDGIIYTTLESGDSWPLTESSGDSDNHQFVVIVLATLLGILALILLGILIWLCLRRRSSKPSQRASVRSSGKWGGADAERGPGNDDDSIAEQPRQHHQPPLSPQAPAPPSRPDSHYPGETAWSTSSVGGPGVPNMTGVGISARNSHATSYQHGDPAHSASHYGASQGDLADSYAPGPYINPNRGSTYRNP